MKIIKFLIILLAVYMCGVVCVSCNVAEVKSGGYKLTRKYYLNDVLLEAPIIHHVKK